MRSIFIVIYVFLFLLLGLPVLGLMWIIGKFNKPWADMAQLRIVQWAFRCIIFMSGSKLDIRGEENIPKDEAVHRQSQKLLRHNHHILKMPSSYRIYF